MWEDWVISAASFAHALAMLPAIRARAPIPTSTVAPTMAVFMALAISFASLGLELSVAGMIAELFAWGAIAWRSRE